MKYDGSLAYLLPYAFAAVFPFALGLYIRIKNQSPVSRTFSALLLAQAIWSLSSFLEIVSATKAGKIFWDDFQFFAVGFAAVQALSFSLRYEGRWYRRGRWSWMTLMLFPLIAYAFAISAPIHGLHRVDAYVDPAIAFGELVYVFGVPMLIVVMPIYFISVAGIARLFLAASRFKGSRRIGALLAGAGLALPLVGTVFTILAVRINGRGEASTLWLAAGDILIAIGLFRYRMADVLPVVRQKIVENMHDPVIVLDHDGLVADYNKAFSSLLEPSNRNVIGRPAEEVFTGSMESCRQLLDPAFSESGAEIRCEGRASFYSVRAFPVLRNERARIVIFRDITALKEAELALRSLSVELERRVEERARELEAEVRRRRDSEELLDAMNAEMENTRKEILTTLADVVETRGRETARHVARVSEYSNVIGRAAGLSDSEANRLASAAAMHDIGKIGIPDDILLQPGPLDPGEMEIMRSHTRLGAEILGKSDDPLLKDAAIIALEHHERWDGTGYPDGKRGAAISHNARIVAVCDVFDSLYSRRRYRDEWEIGEILEHFRTQRGKLFEPALVDCLFAKLDVLLSVASKLADVVDSPSDEAEELRS